MNLPGKRLILGSAVAVVALGVGGVAYAVGNDPVPRQGYVTVEDDATTPSTPSTQPEQTGRDCPEKSGGGQGEAEQNPAGNA